MQSDIKHHVVLHVIIFIWGFTAILGKLISVEAFALVWYRVIIAFVSLFAFLLVLKKKWRITSLKNSYYILGIGVIVALHWLFFYLAIKVSTASLAIICLSTATLHVAWLEPIILKRKVLYSEFLLGIIIVTDILLITAQSTETSDLLGIFYGLIAALMAAMFSTFNAKMVQEETASSITLYEMFSATLVMTALLILFGDFNAKVLTINWQDFWLLMFLGVICTSVAFLVTVEITKFLGAFTVSLSINMEPIYTLGLAAVILQEHRELNWQFYVGATIIVLAVFVNAFIKQKRKRKLKKLANKELSPLDIA
ncbi:MAG: DMT family transporter [Crocinitomicaceae bacterium]|nr:DMT family transporter [Crocinitomicaceae bacterium]